MLPAFSVVIPCFNEAARISTTIRATLDYLHKNSPESELIVVNDGSTDATGRIARDVFSAAEPPRACSRISKSRERAAVRSGLLVARNRLPCFSMRICQRLLEETPIDRATCQWRGRYCVWVARLVSGCSYLHHGGASSLAAFLICSFA